LKNLSISSEVGGVGSLIQLERVLIELEKALKDGNLDTALERMASVDPAAEPIIEVYRLLATSKLAKPSPLRDEMFNSIFVLFKQAIRAPEKWFGASPVLTPGQLHRAQLDFDPVDMSQVHRPPVQLISAETQSGSVLLRIDQVISSRKWGIGFIFQDVDVAQLIRQFEERLEESLLRAKIVLQRHQQQRQ